jgi:hypothetical protein
MHTQYVVVIGLFSRYSTPLEALRWILNRRWRKLPKNRRLLERKFSHGSTPTTHTCQFGCWSRFEGRSRSREFGFWRKRISSRRFSVFHSPGFLHIPLAVFLTIPLLIGLVTEFFLAIPLQKFAVRAVERSDWAMGRAGEWNDEKNQRSLSRLLRVLSRFLRP